MVEFHPRLSERYMDEVEEFLRKKDYTQASEKAWETASQAVMALAGKKG
jgi:hypothetical protein